MRFLSIIFIVAVTALPCFGQNGSAKKKESEKSPDAAAEAPLKPYFGPRKRAIVTAMEVKVQGVTTTASTPSGTATVVTIDIQQPTEFGTGLSDMLTTALVESKRFVVLERQNIEELNKERALTQAADVDPGTAIKSGRTLGAQVIIRGAVTEFKLKRSGTGGQLQSELLSFGHSSAEARIAIDLKLIDVATAQVLDSVRAEGKAVSKAQMATLTVAKVKIGESSFDNSPLGLAVRSAINDGVRKICERAEKLPWEAKVAAVAEGPEGPLIYLNVGRDSGLEPGDVLEISHPGMVIFDPDTKLALGTTGGGKVGKCRVQGVQPKLTIAVPVNGSGFKAEDIASFVSRPPK